VIYDEMVPVFQPGTIMLETASTKGCILDQAGANYLCQFLQFLATSKKPLEASIQAAVAEHPDHLSLLPMVKPFLILISPLSPETLKLMSVAQEEPLLFPEAMLI
jgi:hypothetical protein